MKRLLTSAAMFLCCMATSFAQFTGSGSGTENDPYLILNPIQLNQLRNFLNQEGVYFKLMADIDLTEFLEDENPDQGWQPVGTSSAPFKGILDGNGKKITGFWINRSSSNYIGLFGYTTNARITNVNLLGNTVKGNDNIGFFAGYSKNTTFGNCTLSGSVSGNTNVGGCIGCSENIILTGINSSVEVLGTDYIGGLLGKGTNGVNIENCSLDCDKIKGNNYVGCICGSSSNGDNYYNGCHVVSSIFGANNVGGICGYAKYYTNVISNCGYIGRISALSNVGGIAGEYTQGGSYSWKFGGTETPSLLNCYAIADIICQGDNIGGLVGISNADESRTGPLHGEYTVFHINNVGYSYFSGNIQGEQNVGGIIGYKKGGRIISCYSNATISGSKFIGGICGVIESYGIAVLKSNIANILSIKATIDGVGRIYGQGSATIAIGSSDENKALNRAIVIKAGVAQEVSDDEQNGTGVSLTTLKLKATYVAMGWDFTDIWAIQETECYPYFKTQTAPPVIQSQVVSGATTVSGKCVDGGTVTLEIDGVKQQMVSTGNTFSFTVSPLQAGHEVRVSAKADGKEQSYFTTEVVSFLGKGTEADPYQISTAADLTQVYRKGYYKLMNDIDLTSYINQFSPTEGWQSIGRDGSETIHFDGNGHKITGLWCNSTRDNTGLFSCFANGNIKDLTVETATGKQVKGGANTGILIGKMINGTIENCKVTGTVADGTPVGGMVGLFTDGSITRCQAAVTITTTGATSYVGGLVGEISSGKIDQCVTTGTLTTTGTESYAGGLVGKNYATVTNCYSTAGINSSYNAAGIVAYNYGLVDKCYAVGNLFSKNYAAGIIGYNDGENAVVSNCVAMNNKIEVTYESQQSQQGGGYGQRIIGGIKNGAPAPEMNNYALKTMQVSLNDVPQKIYDDIMNGTAKTAAELTAKATYQELDWDFTNVWKISEGSGYPYLTGTAQVIPDDPNPGGGEGGEDETPDTDISNMNNVIYLNKVEANAGSQLNLSFRMKNTAAIRGFQFDLYLPEGVTAVKSAKGKIVGSLSEERRAEDDEHTLTLNEQSDGAIRFLCGSLYEETFTGNDGEVATLSVKISETMEDGNYAIILKNIKLTESDINNSYQTEQVKTTLTIKSYILGDINNDGKVDVSDYIGVANRILNIPQEGFNEKAADVNEDGVIDVSDYIGVANIILTGSIYGSNNAMAKVSANTAQATDIETSDNIIYVEPATVDAGTTATLSICMKNSAAIRGFQFDMYLPEGVTAKKNNKGRYLCSFNQDRLPEDDEHTLTLGGQEDGSIRFLCGSQYEETFTGTEGEIATIQVDIAEGLASGSYPIQLKSMKLTETNISKYYEHELVETMLTDSSATGINSISADGTDAPAYNLQGQRVQPVQKGLYIVNGKKTVMK